MAEFRWHLMSEEKPDEGRGNYVIIGPKGGMYYATEYVVLGEKYGPSEWFKDTRGNHHHPEEVKAWAEIPSFGSDDTCHITYCEDDYGMDGWLCDGCGEWFAATFNHTLFNNIRRPHFCPSCGRRVIEDVQQEP